MTSAHPSKKSRPTKTSLRQQRDADRWSMPAPLLAIIDEHKYVSRLLPLLEGEAIRLTESGKADYECMEGIMHYMIQYPDQFHHPKEDLIFDRMADLTPKTARAVARLRDDHEKMTEQSKELHQRISSQSVSRSKAKARQLGNDVIGYVQAMCEHMALEEKEVLRPASASLTATDWKEIDEAIRPVIDPLFGDRILDRYVNVMQRYIGEFSTGPSAGRVPVRFIESAASNVERAVYTLLGRAKKASGPSAQERKIDIVTLHTESDMLSYQEKPFKSAGNPRISWQAALTNLAMRMVMKPMMRHADLIKLNSQRDLQPSTLIPPDTLVEPVTDAGFHGDWIIPTEPPAGTRTILHLPGGGFFAPASGGHRKMLGKLACATRSRVLIVNYRLLPDHPFPAGLEDAMAGYRYLLDEGIRPDEIAVSGDSAGGCLALAFMLAAREEGLPLPAACALMSPLTDLSLSTAARQSNRWKDPLLPSVRKMEAYEKYAGDESAEHPLVSPVYGSFHDFPPMCALVSSTETLLDDTLIVARKARAQGVDFEVEIWESLPHAWPVFPFLPEADLATQHVGNFLLRHLEEASHPKGALGKPPEDS